MVTLFLFKMNNYYKANFHSVNVTCLKIYSNFYYFYLKALNSCIQNAGFPFLRLASRKNSKPMVISSRQSNRNGTKWEQLLIDQGCRISWNYREPDGGRREHLNGQLVLLGKKPPASAEATGDMSSIPGSGRSPGEENGNPLQYSCLEKPMDRGVRWAIVHRDTKSWTQPKQLSI